MNTVVAISGWQSEQDRASADYKGFDQEDTKRRAKWVAIGLVLIKGKVPENRPVLGINRDRSTKHQPYSEWADALFPKMAARTASAAAWFAVISESLSGIPAHMTSPEVIQKWFNEQQAFLANTDPVLKEAPAPTAAVSLDKRVGERIVKLIHRKVSGDEGSDIAARALKAYAQQHGTSEAVLEAAAKAVAPDAYYRFAPNVQQQIDNWRDSVRMDISAMERTGLPREAIRSLLINLANSL